jgi:hypothetical protein
MAQLPNIPEDALRQITAGAASVRAAGEALTSRIKAFEAWLGKLPGRVEASCVIGTDPDGDCHKYLSFGREGKEWALYTYDYVEHLEEISDRKLLRDASISEKAWAVGHFHDLLAAMVTAQKSIVQSAAQSVSTFDAFAKSIGLKGGE